MVEETTVGELELKDGFTPRTFTAILFSSLVLMPAFLWVYLSTGVGVGGIAAAYATMLVFGEFGMLMLSPLTEQELATIRWGASMAATFAGGFLFNVYLRKSPITKLYGYADKIPTWVVPLETSKALQDRILWHPDWFIPIAFTFISTAISLTSSISLSLLARELFIEVEKLPFPTGAVAAEIAKSLSGGESERYKIFAISTMFSAIYEIFRSLIPALALVFLGLHITLIPTIHFDLTQSIEWLLPGATTGISTNIMLLALGMIIPDIVVISTFISSLAVYLVLPPILVNMGVYPYERGKPMFIPGTLSGAWYKPYLYFWLSFGIGLIFAGAVTPFLLNLRQTAVAVKSFFSLKGEQARKAGLISGKTAILLFIAPLILSSFMAYYLFMSYSPRPHGILFLAAVLVISLGLSFINTIAAARSIGLMGAGFTIPYADYVMLLITTKPEDIDVWFNPFVIQVNGADLCIGYKAAELTNTKPISIIKAHVSGVLLTTIVGLIVAGLLWHVYDVPSRFLPAPSFPADAVIRSLFITRRFFLFLNGINVLAAFIFGSLIVVMPRIFPALASFTGVPVVFGLIGGMMDMPSNVTAYFLGYLIKRLLEKKMGTEWSRRYTMTVAAGFWTGSSVILSLSTALMFVREAVVSQLI